MTGNGIPVFLKDTSSNAFVQAELRDSVGQLELQDWLTKWVPARNQIVGDLIASQAPVAALPQSSHWNWAAKMQEISGLLAHQAYSISCQGDTEAMMRLDCSSKRCRLPSQAGLDIVYLDYLEVAPWNWGGPYLPPPKYKGLGRIMLRAAVEVSLAEGFKGRLGLHSLPQATGFYDYYGLEFIQVDPGYLPYYELTPEKAQALLK